MCSSWFSGWEDSTCCLVIHVIPLSCVRTVQPQTVCGYKLRQWKHLCGAIWSFFTRPGRCHRAFPNLFLYVGKFPCILGHRDRWSKFLSISEHCRVSVSLLHIPGFLDSERLYLFSSTILDVHDLAWQSFQWLSVSHPDHISFGKFFCQ